MLSSYLSKYAVPIIYLNQVGGQDELVFDGSSMVFLSEKEIFKLKSFEIDSKEVEITRSEEIKLHIDEGEKYESNELADIYDALVMGTKDYVEKNGIKGIIIGSSGGIDSA